MKTVTRCIWLMGRLPLLVGGALLLATNPAEAQFGREYLRYSMYGSGPYGYGSRGYRQATMPEPPNYHDVRDWESDYGYEPHPVYDGTLPSRQTRDRRAAAYSGWLRRPSYYPYGSGTYGPYGRFSDALNPTEKAFHSIGESR